MPPFAFPAPLPPLADLSSTTADRADAFSGAARSLIAAGVGGGADGLAQALTDLVRSPLVREGSALVRPVLPSSSHPTSLSIAAAGNALNRREYALLNAMRKVLRNINDSI